jgi:hypothetical protein
MADATVQLPATARPSHVRSPVTEAPWVRYLLIAL